LTKAYQRVKAGGFHIDLSVIDVLGEAPIGLPIALSRCALTIVEQKNCFDGMAAQGAARHGNKFFTLGWKTLRPN